MRLVVSRYIALLPLANDRVLCGHAFLGPRTVLDAAQREVLERFRVPCAPEPDEPHAVIEMLRRKDILVDAEHDEDRALAARFGTSLEETRRAIAQQMMRSPVNPQTRFRLAPDVAVAGDAWSVVYLGQCLALPSMDALVARAAELGIAIDAAGSFPNDIALVEEKQPAFVVLGDLPRVGLARGDARPVQYAQEMRALVAAVRARTAAPILIQNLVVPTVELDGIAAGPAGLAYRVREIDQQLAQLAAEFPDSYVVDIDAALALAGKRGLVDDAVLSSHHIASLTWIAERARREGAPFAEHVTERAPLEVEYVIADETLRVMRALRGGKRKVVVVDLDDTLWPGVLAETGAPFPPDVPVDAYPHHLWLGLHEALLALRDRGILLACVSKNDEAVVRELWKYPAGFPRALALDDFVTYRIDWREKTEHVADIARELGLGLDTFVFVDDHPIERAKMQAALPEVRVLGAHPFATRWELLTDPELQVPRVTDEARRRTEMTRGQLVREREKSAAADPAAFLASLEMSCHVQRGGDLRRVEELVNRTTQLNTTGARRSATDLAKVSVYTLSARDRFADYGLVGACLVDGRTIVQLVLSCRVIGLDLEQVLLRAAAGEICAQHGRVHGIFVATLRNTPARHVFARAGFTSGDGAHWTADAAALAAAPPLPPYAIG